MNRRERKQRGLMAPQPAAQIAALDFIHAREALDRALAAQAEARPDVSAGAAADVVAHCADRLLGVPAGDAASVAVKVAAYGLANGIAPDLRRPEVQHQIAGSENEAAKGLLAIYMDVASFAAGQRETADQQTVAEARAVFELEDYVNEDADRMTPEIDKAITSYPTAATSTQSLLRALLGLHALNRVELNWAVHDASAADVRLSVLVDVLLGLEGTEPQPFSASEFLASAKTEGLALHWSEPSSVWALKAGADGPGERAHIVRRRWQRLTDEQRAAVVSLEAGA